MLRFGVFAFIMVLGVMAYFQLKPLESTVTVTDARAFPVGAHGGMFMVSMTLENDGDAVTLIGVTSPSGAQVSLMNPGHRGPLVIPANGQGLLAMDGAHMMLSVPADEFEEGGFQSVSLTFDDGSEVVTRVMRPAMDPMGMMDHGTSHEAEAGTEPAVQFAFPPTAEANGFDVALTVENFEFVLASDDADHVAGQGHAHIYLNGLKLGRLYEQTFQVGALPPGDYVLRVALNTNDHRTYTVDDDPVEAVFEFQIP